MFLLTRAVPVYSPASIADVSSPIWSLLRYSIQFNTTSTKGAQPRLYWEFWLVGVSNPKTRPRAHLNGVQGHLGGVPGAMSWNVLWYFRFWLFTYCTHNAYGFEETGIQVQYKKPTPENTQKSSREYLWEILRKTWENFEINYGPIQGSFGCFLCSKTSRKWRLLVFSVVLHVITAPMNIWMPLTIFISPFTLWWSALDQRPGCTSGNAKQSIWTNQSSSILWNYRLEPIRE